MSNFEPLTEQWEAYRDQGLSLACQICAREDLPPLADLDAIYDWCLSQGWSMEGMEERPHVLALAMGLGEHLHRYHQVEWGLGTEGEERHVALRHPPTGAVLWPMAMILRRLSEGSRTTMAGIIGGVEKALADLPRS